MNEKLLTLRTFVNEEMNMHRDAAIIGPDAYHEHEKAYLALDKVLDAINQLLEESA